MKRSVLLVLLALVCWTTAAMPAGEKRWLYLSTNLYVNENVDRAETLLRRAQDLGFNGVLFTDYKTFTWWKLEAAERWKRNAQSLRKITRQLDMDLVVCVFPFGYAGALLFHNPNFASGLPMVKVPLVARSDVLEPVQTAEIRNSSFEEYRSHAAAGYAFQDGPGQFSFIDDQVVKHGSVSLRFEDVGKDNPHGNARICQRVKVQPFQQYRLRVWVRTEDLSADSLKVLALAGGRTLQWEFLWRPTGSGLEYFSRADHLTMDWTEQCVAFNSLDNTEVYIYVGLWGGRTGKLWIDDLRIDGVPTLNLLRRDSLPLVLADENGEPFVEGKDYLRVQDEGLGSTPWPGSYDTRHEPPAIRLTENTRIQQGQAVYLWGFHTALVYGGQVNCSLTDPEVFELCRQQVRHTEEALSPDGYFMSHDEIRVAGWEPHQTARFETTGQALAHNVRTCTEILKEMCPGRPIYIWSDMFDPHHNAHEDFYLVNNTLAGSWEGLGPEVTVMKWGGGDIARPGLERFAARGHRLMIAAYYDSDPATDHAMWSQAVEGIERVDGVMYTTWQNDYSDLETFARRWWKNRVRK